MSINHFLATATDAVGNVSGVAVVPAITTQTPITTPLSGTVYLDLNANGTLDAG